MNHRAASDFKGQIKSPKDAIKKRMRVLYNTILKYTAKDGIELISMFMEKPSRIEYPDYYEVISQPMDMTTVNDRIASGYYKSEEECFSDLKLIFTNCKRYNEEGSDIYYNANTLEKVLLSKAKDLGIITPAKRGRKKVIKDVDKLKKLCDTLRDYKDSKGRMLSLIFLRLPNPKEFPDYFEVIKHPIDFDHINAKIKNGRYSNLDECLAEFVLMFDNACKYNEPDSQIYKDALTLANLAHKTCRVLQDDDNSVPDVNVAVSEILNHIFISMYNHQDAEERCYSDSLNELPEYDEVNGKKNRALSLDLIKQRLDRSLYKRLDTFQNDIFAVLKRARNISRSDSQIFEDAVELQMHFIETRDEACGNGDILQSKALLFTKHNLIEEVEILKEQKEQDEQPEEEAVTKVEQEQEKEKQGQSSTTSATFNQQQYNIGDFVYVDQEDKNSEPFIYLIENIYMSQDDEEQMVYANRFFWPVQTFHVSSRKFLENEVFRSDVHESIPMNKIVGKCIVMSVKEYFRYKVDGFDAKDTYVCESRYQSKARSFKKMKVFWTVPDHIKMTMREEELEPKRVMSVFKERIEKHKEELEEIEAMINKVDSAIIPNVVWEHHEGLVGNTYFEQYTIPGPITLRRGDFVYVRSESGKNLIAQIDTMWTGQE